MYIKVPIGTVVRDLDTDKIIADLKEAEYKSGPFFCEYCIFQENSVYFSQMVKFMTKGFDFYGLVFTGTLRDVYSLGRILSCLRLLEKYGNTVGFRMDDA